MIRNDWTRLAVNLSEVALMIGVLAVPTVEPAEASVERALGGTTMCDAFFAERPLGGPVRLPTTHRADPCAVCHAGDTLLIL